MISYSSLLKRHFHLLRGCSTGCWWDLAWGCSAVSSCRLSSLLICDSSTAEWTPWLLCWAFYCSTCAAFLGVWRTRFDVQVLSFRLSSQVPFLWACKCSDRRSSCLRRNRRIPRIRLSVAIDTRHSSTIGVLQTIDKIKNVCLWTQRTVRRKVIEDLIAFHSLKDIDGIWSIV